jgi:hypothetical protein
MLFRILVKVWIPAVWSTFGWVQVFSCVLHCSAGLEFAIQHVDIKSSSAARLLFA